MSKRKLTLVTGVADLLEEESQADLTALVSVEEVRALILDMAVFLAKNGSRPRHLQDDEVYELHLFGAVSEPPC